MLLARLVVLLAISAAKPSFSNAALISVDDSSPLIQYSLGDWIHHIDQPLNATLFNNTFTVAITGGAVASFPFNGSVRIDELPHEIAHTKNAPAQAIQYWADKNNYHGTVEVGLDGRNLGIFDLNASPKVLPAAIVNVTNLSTDPHVITVKVTTNHLSVDIDRFVWVKNSNDVCQCQRLKVKQIR